MNNETFEVLWDKESAYACLDMGQQNNSNEITAVTVATVFSKEKVEELEIVGLCWASLSVQLEE